MRFSFWRREAHNGAMADTVQYHKGTSIFLCRSTGKKNWSQIKYE